MVAVVAVHGPSDEPDLDVQHPVETALGTDIEPAVGKDRNDFPRWKRREFRLVAGQQNLLTILLTESVCQVPAATVATVHAIFFASKLPMPALQRGEPNAEQQGQLTGPGTIGHALIEDVQGLPAIVGRRQSSPSSPQKA